MSQQQPVTDESSQQLSEEQVRAYLAELRQADVGDIVAQVVSTLLNGAQVKLGRPDGRLLINAAAAIIDGVGSRLDERFTSEVSSILSQLRMAQVEAEKQSDAQSEQDAGGDRQQPAGGAAGAPSAPGSGQQEGPDRGAGRTDRGGSRLWVPPGSQGG